MDRFPSGLGDRGRYAAFVSNMQFKLFTLFLVMAVASVLAAYAASTIDRTPRLFSMSHVDSAALANAANYYISIGEENAIEELYGLQHNESVGLSENELNMRIGWICRILYMPPDSGSFRPFPMGGLLLPHETMPIEKWPLFPIVKSGDTFAVLSREFVMSGEMPTIEHYLDGVKNGTFRTENIVVPSRRSAIGDVENLRTSIRWTEIIWGGVNFNFSESNTWKNILAQAEAIPE